MMIVIIVTTWLLCGWKAMQILARNDKHATFDGDDAFFMTMGVLFGAFALAFVFCVYFDVAFPKTYNLWKDKGGWDNTIRWFFRAK